MNWCIVNLVELQLTEKKYKYLIKIKTAYNHILKKFTKTLL